MGPPICYDHLKLMRYLLRAALAIAMLYAALVAGLAFAMRQPPDVFGAIMAKMPWPVFAIVPFEPLWMSARAGALHIGDAAPDFSLASADGGSTARLSSFRGRSPVVLIFGSYT